MEKKEKIPEPILISTDEVEVGRDLALIRMRLIPELEKLKAVFEVLGLGMITNDYLKDMLFDDFKLISLTLKKNLSEEKISPLLKNEAKKNLTEKLSKVYSRFITIQNNGLGNMMPLNGYFDYPSVDENGNIVLTEEAIQDIRDTDKNSVWASSERAIELKLAHDKAAKALNVFYQMTKANFDSGGIAGLFIEDENGNLIASNMHDYEMFQYARQERK